jgi:Family of unknown function (DUF5677)
MFPADRQEDAAARLTRFEVLFRAQEHVNDLINRVLNREEIRLHDGDRQGDLSLIVSASLAKAMKTFAAVRDLCYLGWGEDALVLVRSNVNLLINLGYILGDSEPVERAQDFIAFSYLERVRYLRTAHGVEEAPATPLDDPATLQKRAERWNGVRIRQRA